MGGSRKAQGSGLCCCGQAGLAYRRERACEVRAVGRTQNSSYYLSKHWLALLSMCVKFPYTPTDPLVLCPRWETLGRIAKWDGC